MDTASEAASAVTPPACRYDPPGAVRYLVEAHGLRIASATLAKARSVGGGPSFQKFGRAVFYRREALDAWAAAKLGPELRSTSDRG